MNTAVRSFPGGTSVTMLDVYDTAAPDGLLGGSPHMHLVSTECYVVIRGTGSLHTLTLSGAQETPLAPGTVTWFTPGTIHRAVNYEDLQVLVLMSNAGLPEAGDAVMTFPADIVDDTARYREAAALPLRDTLAERAEDATRRRDLAVDGFLRLRSSLVAGDQTPLRQFYAAAARIVSDRATEWATIVEQGPLNQAQLSLDLARALTAGTHEHLLGAALRHAPRLNGDRVFGMCGRLRPYDVSDAPPLG